MDNRNFPAVLQNFATIFKPVTKTGVSRAAVAPPYLFTAPASPVSPGRTTSAHNGVVDAVVLPQQDAINARCVNAVVNAVPVTVANMNNDAKQDEKAAAVDVTAASGTVG